MTQFERDLEYADALYEETLANLGIISALFANYSRPATKTMDSVLSALKLAYKDLTEMFAEDYCQNTGVRYEECSCDDCKEMRQNYHDELEFDLQRDEKFREWQEAV